MFKGKKAAYAPTATMAWVIFNTFIFTLVLFLGADDIDAGAAPNTYSDQTLVYNDTFGEGDMSIREVGALKSLKAGLSGLPSWLEIFYITVQSLGLVTIIFAWVRGL